MRFKKRNNLLLYSFTVIIKYIQLLLSLNFSIKEG